MKFNVFYGKLGKERFLMGVDTSNSNFPAIPMKGDMIYLPLENTDTNKVYDGETYVVIQTLADYVHNEYNIFVELYNWED